MEPARATPPRKMRLGQSPQGLRPPSGVDLAHGPSDCACVLHHGHSRNARLLHRQAWLRMSGGVAGSSGLLPSWALVARDQQVIHFRCAAPPTANPDKYADELLDAYLFVEDADALYAEYAAQGVEFT